jgi:hypothetical protein
MPDFRPDAPSTDLFTPEELLVLNKWFGIKLSRAEELALWSRRVVPPTERSDEEDEEDYVPLFPIDRILDEWEIPQEIAEYRRIDVAVAQILLERVQDRLPQWAAVTNDGIQLARPILDRRAHRKVELSPRHLLTINWADSGPGFSWPVAYYAVYVPGFDQTVVTASGDSPETFGACDVALSHFGPEETLLQGSGAIIRWDWSNQRIECEQQRWQYLFAAGLVSEAEANAWADEVWLDHDDTSD